MNHRTGVVEVQLSTYVGIISVWPKFSYNNDTDYVIILIFYVVNTWLYVL